MTLGTIPVGREVVGDFTFGNKSIMASGTVAVYSRVIIPGAGEGGGVVTVSAITRCREMVSRLHRGGGGGAIMTGKTVAGDACMAEHRRSKGTGYMADAAVLVSGDMGSVFFRGSANDTITMTGGTVASDTGMVKGCLAGKCWLGTSGYTMAYAAIRRGGRVWGSWIRYLA